MSTSENEDVSKAEDLAHANGPVAAALVACAIGCFVLGVLWVAGDGSKRLASLMNFYNPAGPLAGVTTMSIGIWLIAWTMLAARWRAKQVAFGRVCAVAFVLLALGLLLTFPPFGNLFLGR